MIVLTGFDCDSFEWLKVLFEPLYYNYTPFTRDGVIRPKTAATKPRLLSAAGALALCLAWTRTQGSVAVLQLIFGITGTSCSLYLRFGRRILVAVLNNHPDAQVKVPSEEKIVDFKTAIAERHPPLAAEQVWSTMDGLKLLIEVSGDNQTQNRFYNGWTHDHYVSGVFVFCPDGTICIASFNAPGCMHDSLIARCGNVYDKLERVYNSNGGKCAVDSAFCRGDFPFLVKSAQMLPVDNLNQAEINQAATSMRQSAEWGMRTMQASFPRLKDRMKYEEFGERGVIMKTMVLLFNVRARRVGINQILNTYMSQLNQNANQLFVLPIIA
jgi:hypothetical protein